MKKLFNAEIYTCDPITGTIGWDIEMVTIYATDRAEARQILKNEHPLFDCVITWEGTHDATESDKANFANGINYITK
jgi:hypothetical protein